MSFFDKLMEFFRLVKKASDEDDRDAKAIADAKAAAANAKRIARLAEKEAERAQREKT